MINFHITNKIYNGDNFAAIIKYYLLKIIHLIVAQIKISFRTNIHCQQNLSILYSNKINFAE